MFKDYSLFLNSSAYVLRVQCMSQEHILISHVTIMFPYYCLCPQSRVYLPIVQSMFQEYSLFPKSTIYVLRVLFMSLEDSLCP